MKLENGINSLVELGFTRIEAEIYIFLSQNSPATGYRIARGLGKPVANVYQSIQTLEKKGAILVEEDVNRLYRVVPPKELLGQLQRQFLDKKEQAEATLTTLVNPEEDDRVYKLSSPEQVLERCRQMLRTGNQIIVIDAFPNILALLKDDIEQAARRNVNVAVNLYQPMQLTGVQIFARIDGANIIKRWPGEWINIVIDGEEYLLAFFEKNLDQVIQAIWSSSSYLSWVYYSALMAELQLAMIKRRLKEGASIRELQSMLEQYEKFFIIDASGYQKLLERFRDSETIKENP